MSSQVMNSDGNVRNRLYAVTVLVVALLAIVAFRAAFSAYFMLDDFGMLAIVRFLDNPFDPFIHNQFPGGAYYRPLGMLVWWIGERVLGTGPAGHYGLNLLLHGLVAAALGSLVSRFCVNRWVGLAVAAAFVLHPIGIGTTLWLSDRFDLLALLFGLLGLHSALSFSRERRTRSLWATLILLGFSLLSKEIALACFAGAGALWLDAEDGSPLRGRIQRCLYLLLPVLAYLIARALIFSGDNAFAMLSSGNVPTLLLGGLRNWLAGWMDYFPFWMRLDGWKKVLSIGAIATLGAVCLAALRLPWAAGRRQALLAGLAIWLASGLLQWPLLAHFGVRLDEDGTAIDTVMNARFFYTSLAGSIMALAALLAPLANSRPAKCWLAILSVALLVPWFAASQNLARSQRIETRHVEQLVTAANAAIARFDVPSKGCQFYLLDTNVWSFGWISDEAIKATTPDLPRIAHCLVQTEHTPWYHLAIMDSLDIEDLRPMRPRDELTQLATFQLLGKARFLFLNLDARTRVPADSRAKFLSWDGHAFEDVTADVLAGRRIPQFFCNRPGPECPR